MSKPPKNIEKILLGVGLLAGAGLVTLGYLKLSQAGEDFNQPTPRPGDSEVRVEAANQVSEAINSFTSKRQVTAATVPSTRLASGEREVDLFVGVALFAEKGQPNDPVDLLQSPPIHEPIPNEWWLEHGIDPVYDDSPRRDADGDGFSNLEEYQAGTLPADDSAFPELADKIFYVDEESVVWFLEFGLEINGKWLPKIQNLTTREKNRVDFGDALASGDSFFADDPFAGRFKFIKIEERVELNKRLNYEQKLKYAIYEDLKPNKTGKRYEIPSTLPKAEQPDFHQYDRTAILELRAIGESGKTFAVEENTRFSLPPSRGDDRYLLKSVTPEQIVVEWQADGETRSRTIPRN